MPERVPEPVPGRTRDVVLASTSRYRRELLARVLPGARSVSPDIDESALAGESPEAQVLRLARAKAARVAVSCPDAIVIGSDQLAAGPAGTLGKPGTAERARQQLAALSGTSVRFLTAVAVLDTRNGRALDAIDVTEVQFRRLSPEDIERYVAREQPLDCAGSFKSEGLGIALFERVRSDDPTALIGLPLIALCRLLRELGVDPVLQARAT
jgi:septum formation protein